MKKMIVGLALACSVASAQTIKSALAGKRIYMGRQDAGHQGGFDGLRDWLNANKAAYGYEFEFNQNPLGNAGALDAVFNRLYTANGRQTGITNPIDIIIFCQGEGDRNVTGGAFTGAGDRMVKLNVHVRNGGGLIQVHAAGGREVSSGGWTFGAKLMTDWFQDSYVSSALLTGNGGHFSANTGATYSLDPNTLAASDSSAYFVRKLQLGTKPTGYAQPLVTNQVKGEWYHFNGGTKYEDGTGGAASNSSNKYTPQKVRGHMGYPDSGIGPMKVFGVLTRVEYQGGYVPPAPGRPSVWGREVSKGPFMPRLSANGRYLQFNPGHDGFEWTLAGNWMGDFFLSTLRWVAKEDLGCMDNIASNYSATATVNQGCIGTMAGRDAPLMNSESAVFGNLSVQGMDLEARVDAEGPHAIQVVSVNGKQVFRKQGQGAATYRVPGLQRGFYVAMVKVKGQIFKKSISIQ